MPSFVSMTPTLVFLLIQLLDRQNLVYLWYISTTFQMLNYDPFLSKVFALSFFSLTILIVMRGQPHIVGKFSVDGGILKEAS